MMYMQICLYDSVYERAVDAAEMQQKTEAVKKLLSGSATGEMNLKAVRITSSIDADLSDELDIVMFTPAVWHLSEMYPASCTIALCNGLSMASGFWCPTSLYLLIDKLRKMLSNLSCFEPVDVVMCDR